MDGTPTENPGEKKAEKTVFVFVKDGCPPCPQYEQLVSEAVPKDVKIKEIRLGQNQDVDSLANVLGIQRTPTAMYVATVLGGSAIFVIGIMVLPVLHDGDSGSMS